MAETPDGTNGNGYVVRVTLKDVYATVQDIQRSVDTLHADLRVHLSLPAHPAAVNFMVDHEARVRSVERWKYAIPIAALIAVGSIVASLAHHV